jgi:hypothetical protein
MGTMIRSINREKPFNDALRIALRSNPLTTTAVDWSDVLDAARGAARCAAFPLQQPPAAFDPDQHSLGGPCANNQTAGGLDEVPMRIYVRRLRRRRSGAMVCVSKHQIAKAKHDPAWIGERF